MRKIYTFFLSAFFVQFIFTTIIYADSIPAPWVTADIGAVAAAGDATYSSDTFTVTGSGKDIWGTDDEFRFVYQQIDYDAMITARVSSLTNPNEWAKAGVMVRESLDANSVNALCFVTPLHGVIFQRRSTTGAVSANVNNTNTTASAPYWVRLIREGDLITAYYSEDGATWTNYGSETISMNSTYYVGLAVTSHLDGSLATAEIDSVTIEEYIAVADTLAPSVPTGLDSSNVLPTSFILSWEASTDDVGVTAYEVFKDGDSIATTTLTSIFVKGLTGSTTYSMAVRARDFAGNWSEKSVALDVTTADSTGDGGFPTTGNTGTNGTLTPHSGDITTTSNGQLIDNLDISGKIYVKHSNVTIRNCKFTSLDIQTTTPTLGENCLVEDCELEWAGRQNFTLRRCFMTNHSTDLIRTGGPNVTIEDCYLYIYGPLIDGAHADIIQEIPTNSGANMLAKHNTLYCETPATSCMNIRQGWTIENNLFAGGSYALYAYNAQIIDNHFSTIFYPKVGDNGVIYDNASKGPYNNICSGNVYHETETPISCGSGGEAVLVTGVSVSPSSLSLQVGQTSGITETVSPSDATIKSVNWTSNNTSIATVSTSGVVTGIAEGTAMITVTTLNGGFTDSCEVTVTPLGGGLTNLALSKPVTVDSEYNGTYVAGNAVDGDYASGASRWLSADSGYPHWLEIDLKEPSVVEQVNFWTGYAGYNFPISDYQIQYWTGSAWADMVNVTGNNNAIVTHEISKIVTDKVRLYATGASDNILRLYEIMVWGSVPDTVIAVTGVSVSPVTLSLNVGETSDLTETVSPVNATDNSVVWLSNNSSIATVDSTGLVTAVAEGTAIIVVVTHDGEYTDTCRVIVDKISGIVNVVHDVGLEIYPNPGTGNNVTLKLSGYNNTSNAILTVFDIAGSTVYVQELDNNIVQFDISNINRGIYIINVIGKDYNIQKKLIIQ